MMNALELSKRMREAGMESTQAEALAQAVDEYVQSNAATKADLGTATAKLENALSTTEAKLHAAIGTTEARLEAKIAASRNTVIFWVAGLLIVATGLNHWLR